MWYSVPLCMPADEQPPHNVAMAVADDKGSTSLQCMAVLTPDDENLAILPENLGRNEEVAAARPQL